MIGSNPLSRLPRRRNEHHERQPAEGCYHHYRPRLRAEGRPIRGVHVLLVAPDDDCAVRVALEALTRQGYAEAELDQIGELVAPPDDEPHASAYQGALEGEVSIVTFDRPKAREDRYDSRFNERSFACLGRRSDRAIEADQRRSADTHLWKLDLPALAGIDLYLKDEFDASDRKPEASACALAVSLCAVQWPHSQKSRVVEASSGSTAVSEAYFARMIGIPFYAVMPRSTSAEKIAAIEHYGGNCHFIDDGRRIYAESAELAASCGGHFMDQFTYAERATDWRGNNNIAESIFGQMQRGAHPCPAWIVMSAGTGGTTATIGRYHPLQAPSHAAVRRRCRTLRLLRRLCHGRPRTRCEQPSRIEGIGRPRVEPSFVPGVIDHMVARSRRGSLAAMRVLSRASRPPRRRLDRHQFRRHVHAARACAPPAQSGSIVTLICDSGERYGNTYYSDEWLRAKGLDTALFEPAIESFLAGGELELELEECWA